MDVAVKHFETPHRQFTLLDAPGHRDFIPNMISGAAQADVALLVVSAATGEFEAGFSPGGQTQEHAVLVRALGVTQLVVVVNKMDMERFDFIKREVSGFLESVCHFKAARVSFIPASGLAGKNLATRPTDVPELSEWYSGNCLVEQIDAFAAMTRPVDKPLRLCVADVYRSATAGPVTVAGKLESGCMRPGNQLVVMPSGERCAVKNIELNGSMVALAQAGDNVSVGLGGIASTSLAAGQILCAPGAVVPLARKVKAKLFTLGSMSMPLVEGQMLVAHVHNVQIDCTVTKLVKLLHSKTGAVTRKHPRLLPPACTAEVKVKFAKAIPLETYEDHRRLGRFMLRHEGITIATAMVLKIIR